MVEKMKTDEIENQQKRSPCKHRKIGLPIAAQGTHSALEERMDLYDVKARGFHSPLNYREIGRLFRAGIFNGRQLCKPRGEATWRTIDQLFPLLKYEAAAPPLRFDDPVQPRKRWPFISACALALALFGTAVFHYWVQSAPKVARQSDKRNQPQTEEPVVSQLAQPASIATPNRPARPLDQGAAIADQTLNR